MLPNVMEHRANTARLIIEMADERDAAIAERDKAIAERDAARQEAKKYRKLHQMVSRAFLFAVAGFIAIGGVISGALLLLRGRCA